MWQINQQPVKVISIVNHQSETSFLKRTWRIWPEMLCHIPPPLLTLGAFGMICHTVTLEYRRISFDVIYRHRRQTHPISNSTAGFRFQGICCGSCGRPDYGPSGCMLHAFACKLSGTFSMCHGRWEKAVIRDWKSERIESECFWWMQILCKRWSGTFFSIIFFLSFSWHRSLSLSSLLLFNPSLISTVVGYASKHED